MRTGEVTRRSNGESAGHKPDNAVTKPKFDNVFRCRVKHTYDGRLPFYEQLVDSITSTRQYKETQAKKVMQGLYENRFALMAVAKTHQRKDAMITEWKKKAVEARYMAVNNSDYDAVLQ